MQVESLEIITLWQVFVKLLFWNTGQVLFITVLGYKYIGLGQVLLLDLAYLLGYI